MGVLLTQSILDGLLVGGVYSCVAIGLSLSLGVMRVFNWAQGDLLMAALYIAVFSVRNFGIDPYLSILYIAPLMFCLGYVVQNFLLTPLLRRERTREPLSVLITTAGLSYVIFNGATILFTSNAVGANSEYAFNVWRIGDLFISVTKVVAFIIALLLTALIQLFLHKTEYGRALRATSQDREVAALMGMNNQKLYNIASGIGYACLGVAAGLMAPMYPVSPATGATFGFKSLVIVVLGGKGSVPGALLGGIIVGLVESVGGALTTGIFAQLSIFIIFALILIIKPTGLLSKDKG